MQQASYKPECKTVNKTQRDHWLTGSDTTDALKRKFEAETENRK